jgi:hypothetical protein
MHYGRFYGTISKYSLVRRAFYPRQFNRELERNRFPIQCRCKVCGHGFECGTINELLQRGNVCYGCDAGNIIKRTAETLFHLVSAIPQWERDQLGIYPADFRYPRQPIWRQEKMVLPGPVYRGPKIQYWRRKWPAKECPALFDGCQGHQDAFQLEPADAVEFAEKERADMFRVAQSGGSVQILGPNRHANLARTQDAYNAKWASYINNNRLSREMRRLHSLNIPQETIELRNSMVANLERDFGRIDQIRAA